MPNDKISFTIDSMPMVDDWYERFDLPAVIGRHKDRGVSLDSLVRGTLAYEFGDNFSILRAGEWRNRSEIREHYELPPFNVRTPYRAVEVVGRNRERCVRELQDRIPRAIPSVRNDVSNFKKRLKTEGQVSKSG